MKTAPFAGTTEKRIERLQAYSLLIKFVSLKINNKSSKGDINFWTCIKGTKWSGTLETSIMTGKREMEKDEKLLEVLNNEMQAI